MDGSRRVSHLNGWRAVEAVGRLGSIAQAAEALGVTPAAIGAQLRGIEALIGQPLFAREPGGLVPLPSLREVQDQLSTSLSGLAAVQQRLAATPPSNQLSLAVTQTFAENWLPRHLPDLFAALGSVDLRLNTSWDVVDLIGGPWDFAIRYMAQAAPGLDAIPLLPTGVVPVCTTEFARRYRLSPSTRDLTGVPLVVVDVPTSDPDWADWTRWSRETGVSLGDDAPEGPRYALTGGGAAIAKSGVGLVLGGVSEVLHAVADGDLIMPLGKGTVVPSGYAHQLVWAADRRLGPLQWKFRDWISDTAARDRQVMDAAFGVRL